MRRLWLLVLVGLFVMVAAHKAGILTPGHPVQAGDLQSGKHLENCTVIGTLEGHKPSKSGQGVVLYLKGADGYPFTAYLGPDVPEQSLALGDVMALTGNTLGVGVLSVSRPDGVKKFRPDARHATLHEVDVTAHMASWQSGDFVSHAPSNLPDGFYKQADLSIASNGDRLVSQ